MQLPGAHRLVRRRAGRVIIYWQAWRGGPPLGKVEGATLTAAEAAEALAGDRLAEAYAAARRTDVPKDTLAGLVAAFRASPEWTGMADSTRKQWTRWLDRISEDLGTFPVLALKARGARKTVITWRNRFAAHPRQADYAVQVLRRVLSWAADNELAEGNPALGIAELYSSDRSAEVVEPHELVAITSRVSAGMSRAFRLACEVGLRRADLVRLSWSDINATSIELATGKSRGRKRIIVPLLEGARAVLAECRAAQSESGVASVKVLTGERGSPYTPNALTHAWVAAAAARPATATTPARPAIDKHLHDCRGTFATRLMAKGLTDEEIADIMGWSEVDDVRKIRRRYVDRDRIAIDLAARLGRRRRTPKERPL